MKKELQRAIQRHKSGDLIAAEKGYREILAENDTQADVWHLLGILLAQQHEFSEAQQCVEKAITLDPNNVTYENSLGNILKNRGNLSAARHHYQKALTLKPDYAVAHHNLATVAYQENNASLAEYHYRQAIQLQPHYADAHYHLGNLLAKQEKLTEAEQHYQTALSLQPQHAQAHYHLAQLLQSQHQWDKAQKHYEQCLAIDPHYAAAYHNLGTVMVKKGDFSAAIAHFLKTLEIEPQHVEAIHNAATTYLLMNKPNEALKYFMQLLQFQKDADIYYNIGTIFMQMDRHADAIIHLQEALKKRPDHLDTLLNLGAAYLKKEDYAHAIQTYQQAAQIKPDNCEIKYILNALEQKESPPAAPSAYLQHLFDQYAPYFEKHLQYLHYQAPQLLYDAVSDALHSEKKVTSMLDLGCGTGLAGEKFRPLVQQLIGIDISEKMIAAAKEKNIYDKLEVMDIEDALNQFKQQALIVAADVFTYIGDLAATFAATHQALNLNGLFAFTVEKTTQYPYVLQQSARYAHSKQYIEELAKQYHFVIHKSSDVILRQQKNQPVHGYLFLMTPASQ